MTRHRHIIALVLGAAALAACGDVAQTDITAPASGANVLFINEAVGFPITGDDREEPSFEWIEDHGLWFEIAYARTDDLRTFILVENGPGTELGIHYLCLSHFWPDDDGSGQ